MSSDFYMRDYRCPHDEGNQHDCAYVDERNRLLPAAEREAYALVGPAPMPWLVAEKDPVQLEQYLAWEARWNRAFHDAMAVAWARHNEQLRAPRIHAVHDGWSRPGEQTE